MSHSKAFEQGRKLALREFQQALVSGEMEAAIERHGDIELLRFLQYRKSPEAELLALLFPFFFTLEPNTLKSRGAWNAIGRHLRTSSLPLLLDIYALDISQLTHAIRIGMIRQLTIATTEELAALSPAQRRQLVYFTREQLRPLSTSSPNLEGFQKQAATLGYLALATLKEPGAERPELRGFKSFGNLVKAIDEYHAALHTVS